MCECKLVVPAVQRASREGTMPDGTSRRVLTLLYQGQQFRGNVVGNLGARSVTMIYLQTVQDRWQLGMIHSMPAQFVSALKGASDLRRCEALGSDQRCAQSHLHIQLKLITLARGGQAGQQLEALHELR